MAEYSMPTALHFGEGEIDQLHRHASDYCEQVALFTGNASFESCRDAVMGALDNKNVLLIDGIPPEPEVSLLQQTTRQLLEHQTDLVVAIGGGSVLDTAKGAALCAAQVESPEQILANDYERIQDAIPVIALPTTSGTGSEVTPFAVFWDHQAKKKHSLGLAALYPHHAIVDPELTYSMPPEVTATTGMDAFTQACEAYWNVDHNPTSDEHALEAVQLILSALPVAVANGSDVKARHDMAWGSVQAGLAFSNTRTAACHSISYPMTLYYGVVHGQAVGITLPEVLIDNAEAEPDRVDAFCKALGVGDIREAAEAVRIMMRESDLKTKLSELGIDEPGVGTIVEHGFNPARMVNNPYQYDAQSLRAMLMRIL